MRSLFVLVQYRTVVGAYVPTAGTHFAARQGFPADKIAITAASRQNLHPNISLRRGFFGLDALSRP